MEQLLEDVVWAYRSDPPPETVLSLSKDQFAAGKYVVEYKLFTGFSRRTDATAWRRRVRS